MNKNTKLALIPFILLALVVTVSYAFFAINPSITEQELSVDAATISLEYTDCGSSNQSDCANISTELKPGDSVTKTFKVENTGSVATEYAIVFKELQNTFLHDELVYTLEDITNNEMLVEETPVPYADETLTDELIANNIEIGLHETVEYRLTVTFKEIEGNQNYNENATFSIKMGAKNAVVTSILPNEYQQVEYIASDGTQYIDTGVSATSNIKIEVELANLDLNRSTHFLGARIAFQNSAIGLSKQYDGETRTTRAAYGNNIYDIEDIDLETQNRNKYVLDSSSFYVNDELQHNITSSNFTTSNNIYLFTANNGGSPHSQMASMRLYSCKIYDSGVLIRDFIPSYRKADNTVGLYDIVNDVFYVDNTNIIKINFTTGNNVTSSIDSNYQQVEYIESNGSQYINTGTAYTYNTNIYIDFQYTGTASSGSNFLSGSWLGSTNDIYLMMLSSGTFSLTTTSSSWTTIGSSNYNRHTLNYNNDNHYILYDDQKMNYYPVNRNTSAPLPIFCVNGGGTYREFSIARIYRYYIKDLTTGEYIRDFVPAVRKSDGIAGLYDKANNRFYENATNTAKFNVGPIVN